MLGRYLDVIFDRSNADGSNCKVVEEEHSEKQYFTPHYRQQVSYKQKERCFSNNEWACQLGLRTYTNLGITLWCFFPLTGSQIQTGFCRTSRSIAKQKQQVNRWLVL